MLNINQYFDGKVASINVHAELQSTSVGLMDIGEYQFSTRQHELMSVINGRIVAKFANDETWPEFDTGESFDVAAEQEFQVKMSIQTAYICTYQDK